MLSDILQQTDETEDVKSAPKLHKYWKLLKTKKGFGQHFSLEWLF